MVVESVVGVETAGGDVGHVQGRRAGAAQRLGVKREVAPPVERSSCPRRSGGKPVAISACSSVCGLLVRSGRPLSQAPEPWRRRTSRFASGSIDDADDQLAGDLQADRDAIERAVVDVVRRAVDRVDDPRRRRIRCRATCVRRVLFAEELVAGEAPRRYSWMAFCEARSASVTKSKRPFSRTGNRGRHASSTSAARCAARRGGVKIVAKIVLHEGLSG